MTTPSDVQENLQRGVAYHKQGDLRQARRAYRGVLREHPGEPDAMHLLGLTYLLTGEPLQAARMVEKALGKRASVALYHNSLGECYAAAGDHDSQAIEHYLEAIRIDAEYVQPLVNLARLYQRTDRIDDAAELFLRALKLVPGSAALHHQVALDLGRRGHHREAMEHLERAFELNPQNQTVKRRLDLLRAALGPKTAQAAAPSRWQEGLDEVYSAFGDNGDREPHPLDDFAATQLLTFFHPGDAADAADSPQDPSRAAFIDAGDAPASNVLFWLGQAGHRLMKKLNGDPASTLLGNWLAEHFGKLCGPLEGKPNEEVWIYFQERCDDKSAAIVRGDDQSIKLESEALALAFTLYVTNASLVGRDREGEGNPELIPEVEAYGFTIDEAGGLADETVDVSPYGDPEDLDEVFSTNIEGGDSPVLRIWNILKAIDANTSGITRLAYDDDNDGDVLTVAIELQLRQIANQVLTDINNGGGESGVRGQ